MTWFTIVTRTKPHVPIRRYATVEGAGNRIFKDRAFDRWTVLAQDGSETAPYRALTRPERFRFERCLYPDLFQ